MALDLNHAMLLDVFGKYRKFLLVWWKFQKSTKKMKIYNFKIEAGKYEKETAVCRQINFETT